MKTILLSVVLGVTAVAGAQTAAQPAQGQPTAQPTSSVNPPTGSVTPPTGSVNPQTASVNPPTGQAAQSAPAAPQTAAPVIKDPAEYNAYVSAVQQTDNNAKISGLEAFLTQYPNSVMKNTAMEVLMGAYQQTNNVKKTLDTATKLVASDPCNITGLTILAFFDRALAQGGDPNAAQLLSDAAKYGKQGLDCLPKVTDPEKLKNKDTMSDAFHSAIGLKCLQDKDYDCAIKELGQGVNTNADTQKDFGQVYPLALSYWPDPKTPTTPENSRNAIWYAARASALAPPQAQAQIEKYARSLYVRFHAGDDGWADLLAKAKAGATQPDLATAIKPAPTPADQAHKMVQDTTPDKMDFATWEFVLTNGNQDDKDAVWNAIKGKAVQMNGTVISTTPNEFQIAGSSDDIDAKKADITLQFEDKIPVKMIPKDGASFDFQGEPDSYTATPSFIMTMTKGTLLRAAAPAAKKPPVHHKPAASN